MEIRHRGLTIQLADDDMRVRVVEALLFGGVLPPPLTPPPEPTPPALSPPAAPPPDAPQALRAYWARLRVVEQQELMLLRERVWRPEELEQRLGVNKNALAGSHSRMMRLANNTGVPLYVLTRGKRRRSRRYMLPSGAAEQLALLVAAGLA